MKSVFFLLSSVLAFGSAFAAPSYTLQQICSKYGQYGQCSSVVFCKEKSFPAGCYLAPGAPAHVEGLCKLQSQKWGCDIMVQQGNCVWVDEGVSTCEAKQTSL